MRKRSEEKNLTTTKVESLSTELLTKLSSKEVNIIYVDDKKTRMKIVNWNYVTDWCIKMKWINIKMIQEHVESTYNKKKLHYSEALRFLGFFLTALSNLVFQSTISVPSISFSGTSYLPFPFCQFLMQSFQ